MKKSSEEKENNKMNKNQYEDPIHVPCSALKANIDKTSILDKKVGKTIDSLGPFYFLKAKEVFASCFGCGARDGSRALCMVGECSTTSSISPQKMAPAIKIHSSTFLPMEQFFSPPLLKKCSDNFIGV